MRVVVISGNIGSGKSTVLQNLALFTALDKHIRCVQEPLEEWKPWLVKMYDGGSEDLLFFQMLVFAHYVRLTSYLDEMMDDEKNAELVMFVERSPFDALWTFLPINQHRADFSSLAETYEKLTRHRVWQEASYVYLHCDPKVCVDRIKLRDRVGEDKIGVEFIQELDDYAQWWIGSDELVTENRSLEGLTETPLMVVNTTHRDPTEVMELIQALAIKSDTH